MYERIGGLMSDEQSKLFVAALKYKIDAEGKTQEEVALAAKVTPQHLSTVMCRRVDKKGKIQNASVKLQERIAKLFGMKHMDFLAIGQRIEDGLPPEDEKREQISIRMTEAVQIPTGPTDYINSDDVAAAAQNLASAVQALANQQRKTHDRQKMWQEVYEMMPSPTLIIKDGVVVYQNKMSLAWGKATGKPLCESCVDEDCRGDDCPLNVAIETKQEVSVCKFIKDDFCKVTVSPMRYAGCEYMIVIATEINECAELFNKARKERGE